LIRKKTLVELYKMNEEQEKTELLRALGAAVSLLITYSVEYEKIPFFKRIEDWPGDNMQELQKMVTAVYNKYQKIPNYNSFKDLYNLEKEVKNTI